MKQRSVVSVLIVHLNLFLLDSYQNRIVHQQSAVK
jgi:hypothetical protein